MLALKRQDIGPALECATFHGFPHLLFLICVTCRWSRTNRDFLMNRSSPLEFYLHRSQFIRLLLSGSIHADSAISYANANLRGFYPEHTAEFQRLMASVVYLPRDRLQRSPYADLALDSVHTDLEPLFAKEYCANLGMSRQVPLRVIGDIGGGGALARIEKARTVMKERKSEWSQTDELPVCTFLLLMSPNSHFICRSKFRWHQRTVIIPFLLVQYPRSNPLRRIPR